MPVIAGDDESEAVAANAGAAATATDEERYGAASVAVDGEDAPWPVDESSEASYRAEVRDRGETIAVPPPRAEVEDEGDSKSLPSVDELMSRIPANVREAMDSLFRAKFVKVRKVPKRVLKGS